MTSADFGVEKDGMFRLFDQIFFGSITKQLKDRKLFKRIKTKNSIFKIQIQISRYIGSSTNTVVKNSSCFSPIVFLAGTWQL